MAVALTTFVLVQAIRGALTRGNVPDDFILVNGFFFLNGWPNLALSIFFRAYVCFLAYWFIRSTQGTERIVMLGW